MHKPPPLQLLPAFDAAARLQSFKAAADELCVTPSAISQQIKTLESLLENRLFTRSTRRIELTPAGERYYRLTSELLSNYRKAHEQWAKAQARPVVRLSTMAQIAVDILIPALPEFQALHPHIDLRIETSDQFANFHSDWIDAAVRVGPGDSDGSATLVNYKLCDLRATLVASPSFMQQQAITSIENIHHIPLIHSRTHTDDWQALGKRMNIDFSQNPQLYFESYHSALTAAENGLGLAFIILPLSQQRLDSGALLQLFPQTETLTSHCYFTQPKATDDDHPVSVVRRWLEPYFKTIQTGAEDA